MLKTAVSACSDLLSCDHGQDSMRRASILVRAYHFDIPSPHFAGLYALTRIPSMEAQLLPTEWQDACHLFLRLVPMRDFSMTCLGTFGSGSYLSDKTTGSLRRSAEQMRGSSGCLAIPTGADLKTECISRGRKNLIPLFYPDIGSQLL